MLIEKTVKVAIVICMLVVLCSVIFGSLQDLFLRGQSEGYAKGLSRPPRVKVIIIPYCPDPGPVQHKEVEGDSVLWRI